VRVLHVIKGLGPGGAERLLVSLASARSADVEMDVAYVLPHKAHLVAELQAVGATVHLLGRSSRLSDPRWVVGLASLVRRVRPDVVHLHSPAVAAVARVVVRTMPRRAVLVSTEHNVWQSFGPVTRLLNGLTLGLGDATLAVSDEVRRSVWSRRRDGVDVVIQGIPTSALHARRGERAGARGALGVGDDTVLVATVANFREKKDYPTLLAAAAACLDDPTLRFVAIGQGPLGPELQDLHHRLGLGDRFRFLGFHPDPPAVLAGADVFALTSRHEGLPIALLEAMALAVPPVASAVGGVPEVITDGIDGLLVAAGDVEGFVTAFRRLAQDPAQRATIAAAAVRRSGDFDITRTQHDLEARYRELVPPSP
jgi:glycosyltransferase involved in cell wall biosynthesis